MTVSVWLKVVLYSHAEVAGRAGEDTKKGNHNGGCDVTSFDVTELPYSDLRQWHKANTRMVRDCARNTLD